MVFEVIAVFTHEEGGIKPPPVEVRPGRVRGSGRGNPGLDPALPLQFVFLGRDKENYIPGFTRL